MKRSANESSLEFERDIKSLRKQALEKCHEYFNKRAPDTVVTPEDADRLYHATCFCVSVLKNKIDPTYPNLDDGGEIVAMGTEEASACGLMKDQDETRLYEYEPTLIPKEKLKMKGEKTVVAVAAGGLHSVCLHRDGTVSTWGANDEYALGRGDIDGDDVHLIGKMEKIKDAIQIGAGDSHTVVLDRNGEVYVSGMYKDIDSGKWRDLKDPQDTQIKGSHKYPCKVLGFKGKIVLVDGGTSWNAALHEDGSTLYTWGMGNSGQLARSESMGAERVQDTHCDADGKRHNYTKYELSKPFMGNFIESKDEKGKTFMGYEYNHELLRDKFLTPAPVEWSGGFSPKRQVLNFSCGDVHFLVVARNPDSFETQVFSSGNSAFGQLGHGDLRELHELTPIKALEGKRISKVAAGNSHSLALPMDGKSLFSWGKIDQGALGLYTEEETLKHDSTSYVATPTEVAFPDTLGESCIVDIAAGDTTSFAITDACAVYSWGYNVNTQTGHYNDETSNIIPQPRLVDVIAAVNNGIERSKGTPTFFNCNVTRVSGGGQHSLMLVKRYE